jgi:hypothetical protein
MAEDTTENKGMGGSFASKLVDGFQNMFGMQNESNAEARKAVAKLATQVQFTQDLIKSNRKKIEKVAETDTEVAKFLKDFDNSNFALLEEVKTEIANGNAVDQDTSQELLKLFESTQEGLGKLNLDGLEASLGDALTNLKNVISEDSGLARETQREFLNDFISVVEGSEGLTEEQTSILELLKEEQAKGFNFDQEQTESLNDILQFFEESKIGEIKSRGTLTELSNKFSSFLVGQDEIKQSLEESAFDGESLKDILTEGLDSDVGQGIIDTLLAGIGLPGFGGVVSGAGGFLKKVKTFLGNGFGKLFGKTGIFSKIFGKGSLISKFTGMIGKALGSFGKIFGKIGSFFGGVGKIAGPVLKAGKFLKVIPVVGTVISAIMGIFDAVSGFLNADEISGKSEEMVTLGDKIQAGISGFLSGLTFGLVEASDIFKGIDKGIDYLFGEGGMFTSIDGFFKGLVELSPVGMIVSLFDKIMGGTGELFGEDGIFARMFEGIKSIGESIGEFVDKIFDFDFKSLLPDSVASLFGDDEDDLKKAKDGRGALLEPEESMFDRVKGFFGGDDSPEAPKKLDFRSIEVDPAELAEAQARMASQIASPAELEERARRAMVVEGSLPDTEPKQAPQVVVAPSGGDKGQGFGKSPQKRNQVDDMTLSAMNVGLLD